MTPTLGSNGCCARAAKGQTAAAPSNATNCHRVIGSPLRRGERQVLANLRQELTWAKGLTKVSITTRRTGLVVIPAQGI